jgi:hypothetical protein
MRDLLKSELKQVSGASINGNTSPYWTNFGTETTSQQGQINTAAAAIIAICEAVPNAEASITISANDAASGAGSAAFENYVVAVEGQVEGDSSSGANVEIIIDCNGDD